MTSRGLHGSQAQHQTAKHHAKHHTPAVGRTLTLKTGSWTPAPDSFRIQSLRDGTAISGATTTTYSVAEADAGHRLSANVTPFKAGYVTKTRTTAATAEVVRLLTTTPTPAIIGAAVSGTTLLVSTPAWGTSPVSLQFQWIRNGRATTGATGTAYTLTATDVGTTIAGTKTGYVPTTTVSPPTRTVTAAK